MNIKYRKGFTLIELLVVIAIIGILSSVVLASLTIARNRGRDAAVKSDLNTVRSEMELVYLEKGESYGPAITASAGNCDNSVIGSPFIVGTISEAISDAEVNGGAEGTCAIGPNGASWAVSIPLAGGGNWCVHDIGSGGLGTASGGGVNPAICS